MQQLSAYSCIEYSIPNMPKILQFDLNSNLLSSNQERFYLMIKSLLEEHFPEVAKGINQGGISKSIYKEPSLVYELMINEGSGINVNMLFGYSGKQRIQEITSDNQGIIYLPKIGYVERKPNSKYTVEYKDGRIYFHNQIQHFENIQVSGFEVIPICPKIFINNQKAAFNQEVLGTISKHIHQLESAIEIIKNEIPHFFDLIQETTRHFCIYNATGADSFASINYHGTCFINTYDKKQSVIFFLDDISHQCGHVIYNMLTIETDEYLNYPKTEKLNFFTKNMNDGRTIYSAFHGLFTYTCILNTLSNVIDLNYFSEEDRFEILARMGFYMGKFGADLHHFHEKGILTQNGEFFFNQFVEGYKMIYNKFINVLQDFKYHNQPYVFDMDTFREINKFQIFE